MVVKFRVPLPNLGQLLWHFFGLPDTITILFSLPPKVAETITWLNMTDIARSFNKLPPGSR